MERLNEQEMKDAVAMFASGSNRTEVAAFFIDQNPELETVREEILQQLRLADPTSNRFAVTKYQSHYEIHREGVMSVVKNHYEVAISRSIESMSAEIDALREQLNSLDYMLESAVETNPVGTGEYLSTMNMRNQVTKRISDLHDKLLERLERVRAQTDLF